MKEIIVASCLSLILQTSMASQALSCFAQGRLGLGIAFLFGIAISSALAFATIVDFAKRAMR